jgi:hypothetical protein
LEGALQTILWPKVDSNAPQRKDELWKSTCFEAFFSLSQESSAPYIEINCSPAGDWNIYSFDSYRQGMAPAQDLAAKLTQHEMQSDRALFVIQITGPLPAGVLWTSLTAVIQFIDGTTTHWALRHGSDRADFHDKSTFIAKT